MGKNIFFISVIETTIAFSEFLNFTNTDTLKYTELFRLCNRLLSNLVYIRKKRKVLYILLYGHESIVLQVRSNAFIQILYQFDTT